MISKNTQDSKIIYFEVLQIEDSYVFFIILYSCAVKFRNTVYYIPDDEPSELLVLCFRLFPIVFKVLIY